MAQSLGIRVGVPRMPLPMADVRFAPRKSVLVSVDPESTAPVRSAPDRLASVRSVSMMMAPERFARDRSARLKSARLRFTPERSEPARLAPAQCGRQGGVVEAARTGVAMPPASRAPSTSSSMFRLTVGPPLAWVVPD